jgi:hypothetical protein
MGCNTFSSSFPLAGINKPETRLFIIIELTKQEKKKEKKEKLTYFPIISPSPPLYSLLRKRKLLERLYDRLFITTMNS